MAMGPSPEWAEQRVALLMLLPMGNQSPPPTFQSGAHLRENFASRIKPKSAKSSHYGAANSPRA
eukprot:10983522-Alexandrium_andersonii.AAC.1